MTYFLFLVGLVGLFLGGEVLIRGAVGVARRFHVPPLIIGLTIVGFGTSTPELLVGLQAALAGAPALATGNVIGSNIANILLILGASAVIATVPLPLPTMQRDFTVMIGATLTLWLMLAGGTVTRFEGLILLAALAVYLWQCLRNAAGSEPPTLEEEPRPLWQSLAMALGGLIILMVGARLLVDSSTEIARAFGVSEAVIGLTIVAIGTSLPELATAVIAALRGHSEIAVGNILGSNVFNILGILGVTATVTPIPVEPRFVGLDMGLALLAALAMLGFAALTGKVARAGGGVLLAAYAAYIGVMGAG